MRVDPIGHQLIKKSLSDYLPPATLLVGPPSIGKSLLASWAAREHGASDPDISNLGPLTMPAARQLVASQSHRPFGAVKAIVTELDNSSPAASAAILKAIEEPPRRHHAFLLTSRLTSVPLTLISRCHVMRVGPLSTVEVAQILIDILHWEPVKAASAARLSGGTVEGALSAADRERVRAKAVSILQAMTADNEILTANVLSQLRDADAQEVLTALRRWCVEATTGQYLWFGPEVGREIIRCGGVKLCEQSFTSGARPVLAVRRAFALVAKARN